VRNILERLVGATWPTQVPGNYALSKAGMGMSKSLAYEVASRRINS